MAGVIRNALTPESSLGGEVNEIGSKLKQLQEQLQKLEKQNEGNEKIVADWGLQIRQLYSNISDIEDDAFQLLRRFNGKGVGGLAKSVLFSLSQRKDSRELRARIRQVQEKMKDLNENITHTSSRGREKLDPLTARCDHQKSGENRVNRAVGMDEKIKRLVSFLEKDSQDDCPFFAVYGMGGVGKTTLVRMVYNTPDVRHKFMGCAWITAPHQVQTKTLWQDILSQIQPGIKDEIKELNDRALGKSLRSSLQSKKFLIVLDDVYSTEALLIALPANTMMRSKIVITTRDEAQAVKIVSKNENILPMIGLNEDQSWDLFLKTQLPCHISEFEKNKDLKAICRDVVKKCEGVPLAIKVIGDLMAGKHTMEQWKLLQHKNSMSAEDTLELSYNLLPEHLKKCLLYLALFPKDTDIEAEKLYNLWIAEGMITSQQVGNSTMLSTAETYLKELASLGLVEVREKETPTLTDIKSCRLHDLVRDLCSRKGKEESLFAAVDLRAAHNQSSDNVRALAYYFDKRVGKYEFSLKPETSRQVRSFLFLNAHLPDEHLLLPKSLAFKNFRFLRVLDFNSLDFHEMKLPKDMENLATLRYLSFRDCCLDELSSSIGKLPNLEILDLRVNPMLDLSISNVLFKLTNLRNLYFPYKFHGVGDQKLQLDGLSMLENLKHFVSSNCRANDLLKLGNLKYLVATIEGNMEDLEVTINCINQRRLKSKIDLKNFDCYSQRRHSTLRNLMGCKFLHALRVEGHIGKLSWPNSSKLIKEIFLIGSELTEDPMPVLGNFPQLHKLGLCNGAFLGDRLVCSASSFPRLRYFKLANLYKLKIWTLEQGAMPKLSTLTIERCQSLQTLPAGLSTNLQELSTVKMDESFTAKYRSEGEDFSKIQHVPIIKVL